MQNSGLYQKVAISSLIVFAIAAGLAVVYFSASIFLSALIGIGIAAILNPAAKWIESKTGISRTIATLLVLCSIILLFLVAFFLVGTILIDQLESLRSTFPEIVKGWQARWQWLEENYPGAAHALSSQKSPEFAEMTVGFLGAFVSIGTAAGTGLTLALVIAVFTALNAKEYKNGLLQLFPKKRRDKVEEYLNLSGEMLCKWVVAQGLDMIAVFVLTSLGLWIANIQYWFVFGLLAGLLSIMPYVGLMIVIVLAGGVVLILQPEKVFALFIVFFITQQLEGNLIMPKLMKDRVEIPTAPLLFAMILVGHWLGALGVLVTPPLMAISICAYNHQAKSSS